MKKKLLAVNKLIAPIYLYLLLLIGYLIVIPYINSEGLSDFMLYSVVVGLPIAFCIWLNIRLKRIRGNKTKYLDIFLISLLPGFFPGAMLGYAFWIFGHGDTILGFLVHILGFGLPTGIIFGTIGILVTFIFNGLR